MLESHKEINNQYEQKVENKIEDSIEDNSKTFSSLKEEFMECELNKMDYKTKIENLSEDFEEHKIQMISSTPEVMLPLNDMSNYVNEHQDINYDNYQLSVYDQGNPICGMVVSTHNKKQVFKDLNKYKDKNYFICKCEKCQYKKYVVKDPLADNYFNNSMLTHDFYVGYVDDMVIDLSCENVEDYSIIRSLLTKIPGIFDDYFRYGLFSVNSALEMAFYLMVKKYGFFESFEPRIQDKVKYMEYPKFIVEKGFKMI